jgi:hypothetical protein
MTLTQLLSDYLTPILGALGGALIWFKDSIFDFFKRKNEKKVDDLDLFERIESSLELKMNKLMDLSDRMSDYIEYLQKKLGENDIPYKSMNSFRDEERV